MTTILANEQAASDLRARLNRLTRAAAARHPGAHRMLTHALNALGAIADHTAGLDLGDWNTVHAYAMTCVENANAAEHAGQPVEEHGRALQHYITVLAGIISRALDKPATPTDQVIETLATYTTEHQLDTGGQHLRTALVACLITRLFDLPADQAADLAWNGIHDERVQVASDACEEMLDRIRRAQLTAQDEAWTPKRGDTVTWTGHDGVWTVTGFEDDDNAWLRLQRDSAAPAGTFADYLASTDAIHFGPLAAVADLLPATTAEVTV